MEPSQLNGVVIITLPPVDNPSKGKTITSIFTLSEPNDPSVSPTPSQQHDEHHLPLQSLQQPQQQIRLSFRSIFKTSRGALALLSVGLLAMLMWSSLTSSNNLFESKSSDDEKETNSFVFPLYPKLGLREKLQKDVELKLGRVVQRDVVNDAMVVKGGVKRKEMSKMGSLVSSSSAESSTIFSVRGNVYPYGLYYVSILVGNPPRPYHLDMDTGSDLTWIQCDAPCTSCAKGPHPLYKPSKGNIVPSNDLLCKEVENNQKNGHRESSEQCDYEIEYADLSSSMGVLARDELQLMIGNGTLLKLRFGFGCAYDQQGQLSVSPAKTDGILGLNGAKVSFSSQLASQGIIQNVVGHCIGHDKDNHGYMFLGDDYLPQWGMTWVPMLSSPSINSYHSEVVKINYGREHLSLGGIGRAVFDSGSSYTYFTKEAYSGLLASLEDSFDEKLIRDVSDPTLPVCWRAESPIRSLKDVKSLFQPLTLHFGSKWWIISRKLSIPPEGYLILSNNGNVCLGILDGSDVYDGSTIILGDVTLQGQLVVYDNVNQKIGWIKSDCLEPQRHKSFSFFFK